MPETIAQLLQDARRRLAATPFRAPRREAGLLLGFVLGLSEAQVLSRGEQSVPEEARRRFYDLLDRRLAGEPVAYLLGEREFYGRPFAVDRRVLIPRPETEHLVEAVLAEQLPERPRVVDVGTGSGCLAVTLALELPRARVIATDLSADALAVALFNVHRHGVPERVRLLLMDSLEALDVGAFDLVVSNPPYVDPADAGTLSTEVRDHEPHEALFAGDAGLAVYRRLLDAARSLEKGAPMVLEIGHGQLPALADEAENRGLTLSRVVDDYAGIPRTVVIRRSR